MTSIRRQLTLRAMCSVVLLYGLAACFCYARTRSKLNKEFDGTLVDRARALRALVQQEPNGHVEIMPTDSMMPEFGHVAHPQYLQMWAADGRTIERSPSLGGADLDRPQWTGPVHLWDVKLPDGRAGRAVALRFNPGIEQEEDHAVPPGAAQPSVPLPVTLVLLHDRGPVSSVENVLLSSLAVAFLLLCAGTLLVVPPVVARGLRPLRRLSDHAGDVDVHTLSARFPDDGLPAELRPIAACLNDLLARLEAGFRRERRFSADVAHELRTPIAELRALAEVALRWPGDSAAAERGFADVLSVARQMEAVVTTLLALARFESGRLTGHFEPVDVAAVVRDAWRRVAGAADPHGLAVTFDLPGAATINADRNMVLAIATNLLSNAVSYCPAGGSIQCTVSANDSSADLRVSNTNNSLTTDDLGHVALPFWRKDSSRSSPTHSGLGLALVSAYAEVHGAKFTVELTPQNMFSALVEFPRASCGSCNTPVAAAEEVAAPAHSA